VAWLTRFYDFNSVTTLSVACRINSFVTVVSYNHIAFWNLATALFITLTIVRPRNYKPDFKFELICHFVIWPFGIFMGCIGGAVAPFDDWYGLATAVCYISDRFKKVRVYFVALQVGISLLVIIFLYTGVALYAWNATRNAKVNKTERIEKRKRLFFISFYPVIYFFIWFPYIVVRMQQAAGDTIPITTQFFTIGLLPWTGFINGIWYGYSRQIFQKLRDFFNNCDQDLERSFKPSE